MRGRCQDQYRSNWQAREFEITHRPTELLMFCCNYTENPDDWGVQDCREDHTLSARKRPQGQKVDRDRDVQRRSQ